VDALAGLMFAYQLQRRPEEAHMALQRLFEYTTALNDPACPALAATSGIRLSIMQGQMGSAITRVEATAPPPAEVMLFWLEIPCISHCRALIAQGSAVNLRKAEDRLQAYVELNESHHNTFQLIGILCLQAMVFEKRRKPAEACATLERAVTLSRTGGFIFPFLELGPQMADLLNKLIKKNFEVDFIRKLLAAFHHVGQSGPKTPSHKDSPPPSTTQPLIEPLSHRELDVLELLSKRLQNKEIAEKLSISPLTVKSHLKNIYQKLSVGNRRQAVERAGELGILTK
jgi:LuxR family maltose regulon positive regulatory protein